MRRILIAATILSGACGKKSILATPEIKASVSQARLGISSASTNTKAIIAMQSLGSTVAGSVSSGSVATVDLTAGLPDPGTLATSALMPPAAGFSQDLQLADPVASGAALVVGCLKTGLGGSPTLALPGQSGCSAADHLEVTYDSGDKLNITWVDAGASFDLAIAVAAGPWTGTNLRYAGSASSSGASVSVNGTMQYAKAGSAGRVDADVNLTYVVTGSQSATDANIGLSVNGTTTDRVALVRANERWSLNLKTSSSGQGETLSIDWNGSVGIDLLKADGNTKDHSVGFNVNLHMVQSTATAGVTCTAGGEVDYDGSVVGNPISRNDQLIIHWTDGAEEPFDPAVLFGSFAV